MEGVSASFLRELLDFTQPSASGAEASGACGLGGDPFFVGESPPLLGFPVGRSGRSRKRGPWPARNLAFLVAVETSRLANCSLLNKP